MTIESSKTKTATWRRWVKNYIDTVSYETGTWTPTLSASTTNPTISGSYTNRIGTYTKIGNVVTVVCNLRATLSSAGSGTVQVTGLPFAGSNLPGISKGIFNLLTYNGDTINTYIDGNNVILGNTTYKTSTIGYITFSASYIV